jgi:hypothetical protein
MSYDSDSSESSNNSDDYYTIKIKGLEKEIRTNHESKFYSFGDPYNLYKYEIFQKKILEIANETYEHSYVSFDDIDSSRKHQIYQYIVNKIIKEEKDDFCIGDIVYMEHPYESRQYYGLYLILIDEKGEKYLYNYMHSGLYVYSENQKLVKELLEKILEKNKNFFNNADFESIKLVCNIKLNEDEKGFAEKAVLHYIENTVIVEEETAKYNKYISHK